MKKLIRPNVIDLGKALRDMPIGDELEIPHSVARESQVRGWAVKEFKEE